MEATTPNAPYAITLVEGEAVHTQLGISDERFAELGRLVQAVMEDDKVTKTSELIAAVSVIGQTPSENVVIMLQVGKHLRNLELMGAREHARAFKDHLEELAELFGELKPREESPLEELLNTYRSRSRRSSMPPGMDEMVSRLRKAGIGVKVVGMDAGDEDFGSFLNHILNHR